MVINSEAWMNVCGKSLRAQSLSRCHCERQLCKKAESMSTAGCIRKESAFCSNRMCVQIDSDLCSESLNTAPYISSDHQLNSLDTRCALIHHDLRLEVMFCWFVKCFSIQQWRLCIKTLIKLIKSHKFWVILTQIWVEISQHF